MLNLLFFMQSLFLTLKKQACANFNVNLYLSLACLQFGSWLLRLGRRSKVMGCGNA